MNVPLEKKWRREKGGQAWVREHWVLGGLQRYVMPANCLSAVEAVASKAAARCGGQKVLYLL